MRCVNRIGLTAAVVAAWLVSGCAASKVDFANIKQPARPAELDAYDVFVGSWTWYADMLNAEGPDKKWTWTAEWMSRLPRRSWTRPFMV